MNPFEPGGAAGSSDPIPESFRRNAWIGFAAAGILIVLLATVAMLALRSAVASDRLAFLEARDVIDFGRFQSEIDRKVTALRNYVVVGDFASVVREVTARLDETLSRADCALVLRIEEPQIGEWDRLRLDQVVTNLLSNAVKYGGGRPIEVALTGETDRVRLDVTDHGIGVEPENQSRIFERFERAVSGHHYGGLGLGLWIARQIVDGLGGRISVRSAPRQGSVFSVDLPRTRAADPASAAGRGADVKPSEDESEDRVRA